MTEMNKWNMGVLILVTITLVLSLLDKYFITVFDLSTLEWWGLILSMVLVFSGITTYKNENNE